MSGNSLAHWAAYGGNLNAIIVLESHGCPLFVENNENKHTPLSTAVCNGHSEICVYLLHKGAQLADTDAYGRNALQLAVIFGHADLLRILVRESQVSSEQIADLLRHKDNYGNDALCGSVLAGVSGPDMITALIELGLCPDGEEGTDPFPLTLAIQNNRPEIARALLGHGANPNLSGSALRTPLFAAFERDDVGIAKTLIEAGASPFALTPEKVSILQWLCKRNEKAAVRLLVNSKKFQQDFPAGEEWTPLMYAAFLGDHDLIAGELGRPDPCVGYVAPDGSSAPALMVSNGLGEWVGDLIGQGRCGPPCGRPAACAARVGRPALGDGRAIELSRGGRRCWGEPALHRRSDGRRGDLRSACQRRQDGSGDQRQLGSLSSRLRPRHHACAL